VQRAALISALALACLVGAQTPVLAQFGGLGTVTHSGTIASGGTGDVDVAASGTYDGVGELEADLDYGEVARHSMWLDPTPTDRMLLNMEGVTNSSGVDWIAFEFEIYRNWTIDSFDTDVALSYWDITPTGTGERLRIQFVDPIASGESFNLTNVDMAGANAPTLRLDNTPRLTAIPEPGTVIVLGIALAGLAARRRRGCG